MNNLFPRLPRIVWYAMVALLPITSMPLVKRLLGSDTVASPAIFPLIFLLIIWIIPGIKTGIPLPKPVLVLWVFVCFSVMVTFLSYFFPLPALKGFDHLRPTFTALATLAIGFSFFLAASSFPIDSGIKRTTLQIINWSGFLIILWSAAQAVSWYGMNRYPQWMFDVQGFISSRVLYRHRVTGLALEPSWLAHQLNLLYLPAWLAASICSYSSHSKKIIFLSFENLLLIGGIGTLVLTLSRVGFLSFGCMMVLAVGLVHGRLVDYVAGSRRWKINQIKKKNISRIRKRLISVLLLAVYLLMVTAGVFVYSRFDPRMRTMFDFNVSQENFLLRYFNELRFGDRVIYWISGWNIFNERPLLGVGLGNAGFFIPDNIEPHGWSFMEVRRLIHRESFLLNIKNLWFRLLAETGIIGFALFIGWKFSVVGEVINKLKGHQMERVLALGGAFTLLALIFEGFSIDSFAMPYWWISLGLACSTVWPGDVDHHPKPMDSEER